MLTQWKNNKKLKDFMTQFMTVVVVAALALLLLNVLSDDKDGRRQVVDNDGGEEYVGETMQGGRTEEEGRLAEILGQIKGVGTVKVMITYRDTQETVSAFSAKQEVEKQKVKGVIIAAEGAASVVTKNDIMKAVSSVYDIPQANVMVFEKEEKTRGY